MTETISRHLVSNIEYLEIDDCLVLGDWFLEFCGTGV